jgi:hypothetical protein
MAPWDLLVQGLILPGEEEGKEDFPIPYYLRL